MTFSERDTLTYLADKVGHGFKMTTLLYELRQCDDFEPVCHECGECEYGCSCTAKPDGGESRGSLITVATSALG